LTHLEKEAAGAVPGDLTAARPEDVDRVIEVYSGKIAL
jgi:hypothetical protein